MCSSPTRSKRTTTEIRRGDTRVGTREGNHGASLDRILVPDTSYKYIESLNVCLSMLQRWWQMIRNIPVVSGLPHVRIPALSQSPWYAGWISIFIQSDTLLQDMNLCSRLEVVVFQRKPLAECHSLCFYLMITDSVFRAVNVEDHRVAACKVIHLTDESTEKERKTIDKEMKVHAALKHVNVLEFLNAVVVELKHKQHYVPGIYMLLEFAAGGDLFDKI